jgi:hypothetical protein
MLSDLITHAGSSALGGLLVAASLWLKARAKSEENAGEAVKVKAASDAAVTTHLLATVEQLKADAQEFRRRHEECERKNADCDRNFAQLRHEFEIFRGNSMMTPPALPPRMLP